VARRATDVAYDARPAVLVGLIGPGIQGSRTPAVHEREGALQGLRYVCQWIDLRALKLGIEALSDLLLAAERMGFAGLNITHPAKQAVLPLLEELSRPRLCVADIVYVPLENELLRCARALGCRTLDGGDMAVFQTALAFRLFTGIVPDTERMRRHFATIGTAA
jgi:shikimate 5-dehydrogenase